MFLPAFTCNCRYKKLQCYINITEKIEIKNNGVQSMFKLTFDENEITILQTYQLLSNPV